MQINVQKLNNNSQLKKLGAGFVTQSDGKIGLSVGSVQCIVTNDVGKAIWAIENQRIRKGDNSKPKRLLLQALKHQLH